MPTIKLQNRFYVLRHGQSTANERGVIASHPQNAINDYGLTQLGVDQVLKSIERCRHADDLIIVSSDFKRAIESANIVHTVLATAPPTIDQRLRERDFGRLELESDSHYYEVWNEDASQSQSTFDVELMHDVQQRALSVLFEHDAKWRNKTLLLVGHGDVLQALLAYFAGLNVSQHRRLPTLLNGELRPLKPASG